jgi:Fe-S cluster assembly protein SufD
MTVMTKPESSFRELYARLSVRRKEPVWLTQLRERGMQRFDELGFPTIHDEDWRFTNVAPIATREFHPAPQASLDAADLAPFAIQGLNDALQLVFVNGRFAPGLSRLRALPKGVTAGSLAAAIARDDVVLQKNLGRLADAESNSFTALGTALFEDGLYVHVPARAVVEEPIHAIYVNLPGSETAQIHARSLIVAERESKVNVIEDHVSLGEGIAFTNALTEIAAGEGTHVRHCRLERENMEAMSVLTLHSEQGRDSDFASHSALLGGALVRNGIYPSLRGTGCTSLLNGIYVAVGAQHHDTHMRVRHAEPHCGSRQFYRGILDDQARGVFSGRIIVHEGAQKTDAKQTSMNLLLSDQAHVEAKPQLEIYADDVKCTHGATVGQIDGDALFYLQARGIDEDLARMLLIFAFANEVLDRIEIEPVRELLRSLVGERLPQSGRELAVP